MNGSSRKKTRRWNGTRPLPLAPSILHVVRRPVATGAGAIVMAGGIFVSGALRHFPALDEHTGRIFVPALLAVFVFIGGGLAAPLFDGTMRERHFADPVDSFAVGTWIAATSVCATVVSSYLPLWRPAVFGMVVFDLVLWAVYLRHIVSCFIRLAEPHLLARVNGVVLLSTVSTQSIVVAVTAAFGRVPLLETLLKFFILLGLAFYLAGLTFIALRYLRQLCSIDLDRDWANSNCIIHGAMSITGLAASVSSALPSNLVLVLWLWALCTFVVVEAVEVLRASLRTRRLGLLRALSEYSLTQWSRNFTFGMLYAFTLNFSLGGTAASGSFLRAIRSAILAWGAWVVLVLLVYEILLALRSALSPKEAG